VDEKFFHQAIIRITVTGNCCNIPVTLIDRSMRYGLYEKVIKVKADVAAYLICFPSA
jgi:hypothetical protein